MKEVQTVTDAERGTHYVAACPYCLHRNKRRIQDNEAKQLQAGGFAHLRELVACDNEDGGCDRDFYVRVRFEVVFHVETLPIRGLDRDADDAADDDAPDLRVWQLKTKAADEPGEQLHAFNVAELSEMAGARGTRPLYALALTMRGGDKLEFHSVEGLVSYYFECFEPEESDRFHSFELARREARRRSVNAGSEWEIYFDGERFRLYSVKPLPVPPPPDDFELVARVEVPVVFRIEFDPRNADAGQTRVEVHCNDNRANPGLQDHGETLVYYSDAFPAGTEGEREAVRDAVSWIHSEHGKLDVEVQAPFDLSDVLEDLPFDDGNVVDDRRIEDRD